MARTLAVRLILLLALLLQGFTTGSAQQFGAPWIACGQAGAGQTAWFCQRYLEPGLPQWAMLTVATTGQVQVCLNGRRVAPLALMPHREAADTTARALTFDVSALLRPDTNVVAVWYAPSSQQLSRRQLSLCFYGIDADGSPFARYADEEWLCRVANTWIASDGNEWCDASQNDAAWTASDIPVALWQSAEEQREPLPYACGRQKGEPAGCAVTAVVRPRYFDLQADSVVYDFAQGFVGQVRLTLRDARPGQHLRVAGLHYVCSGENDEQFIQRFTLQGIRRMAVGGDAGFSNEQVQRVEALCLSPVESTRWPDWRMWSY